MQVIAIVFEYICTVLQKLLTQIFTLSQKQEHFNHQKNNKDVCVHVPWMLHPEVVETNGHCCTCVSEFLLALPYLPQIEHFTVACLVTWP